MEDRRIIQLYLERNEAAVGATKRKYGAYCHHLAYGILNNDADADEVVNDTWFRVWNSIPPQQPAVLKMFLAKITRNLAMNRRRDQNAQKRGGGELPLALEELKECIPARENVQDVLEGQELARVIQIFLQTQSVRDRNIFVRRYFCLEPISVIAERFAMTEAAVRKVLSRIRARLKKHLNREGYVL